ncbi:phosphate ABC transporter substrate-binding protein PstS [Ornithinimicrobium sp. Y1694]|uniref:phosphate ABC transporter substrate-binding protein PstS n=1 Tax=Ornithinimicrobium sp. Y1694 TaxID=3418590 RepID=UPI003CEECB0C
MKLRRFAPTVAIAMAASITLAACGDDTPTQTDTPAAEDTAADEGADEGADDAADTAGAEDTEGEAAAGGDLSGSLTGAGASAQEAAQTAWIAGFQGVEPGVTVNYDSVGSGAGIGQLIAGAATFAGSDAYLNEDQRAEVQNVCSGGDAVNVPVYISPIAVPFNLPGVDELNLKPDTMAKIFAQEITSWDDEEIAADNPDADLPSTPITVVNRSDESGTTENFTDYLAAAAPDVWTEEPSKTWPISGGEAAPQTSGVINAVRGAEGSIGYADASAVGDLATVKVGVGEDFVEFSPEAAAKVVEASPKADTGVEGDLAIDLAHDTEEAGAYPIVLVSYLIMCKQYEDADTANLVKAYSEYIVSEDGQNASADAAGSAPISSSMRDEAMSTIDAITGG